MRRLLIMSWLALPLILILTHTLAGERLSRDDQRQQILASAQATMDPEQRAALLAEAASLQPAADAQLAIDRAAALSAAGDLSTAINLLQTALQQQTSRAPNDPLDPDSLALRHRLAEAHYHAAWLLRRDGANSEDWLSESEIARGHLRLLAEAGDQQAAKDLEMVIRFQRTDAAQFDPLALPKNCPNSSDNLAQRQRQQRQSRSQSPSDQDGEEDSDQPSENEDGRQELQESQARGAARNAFNPDSGW